MPVSYSWEKKYWKQAGGEANLNQSCQKTTPPLLQQVPGCGSFIYIPPLVFQEVREHFTEQNKDFIVMYCSRKVIHIRGVEAPGSKSQFFFSAFAQGHFNSEWHIDCSKDEMCDFHVTGCPRWLSDHPAVTNGHLGLIHCLHFPAQRAHPSPVSLKTDLASKGDVFV